MKNRLFTTLVALFVLSESLLGQALYGGVGQNEQLETADFPRVTAPAMVRDDQAAVCYEAIHFWDHFPFAAYTQFSESQLQQTFVEFVVGMRAATPAATAEAMGNLMKRAATNIDCYWFFLELAEEGLYDPNSPMRDDWLFENVLRHAVGSGSPLDETSKMRYRSLLRIVSRNQEGARATDFVYTLPNGAQRTLYKTPADLLLLYFYNPGCPECRNVKRVLTSSGYAEALHNIGLLTVVAVHPDEELDEWRATLHENPSWWISAYDKGAKILSGDLYDLKAIPTLYLLDGAKNVLLKDAPVEEVVSALSGIYQSVVEQM